MRKIYTINKNEYFEILIGMNNKYFVYHGSEYLYELVKTFKTEKAAINYVTKMGGK